MLRLCCSLIVVLMVVSLQVYGSCSRGSLKPDPAPDAAGEIGTTQVCLHTLGKYSIGTNWTVDFPDCLECQCKASVWVCCGYGINAGVIEKREGYELAPNTCEVTFVKVEKATKPCGCADNVESEPKVDEEGGTA